MKRKKILSILLASAMVGTAPASAWASDFTDVNVSGAEDLTGDTTEETTQDVTEDTTEDDTQDLQETETDSTDELQDEDTTDFADDQVDEFSSDADATAAFDDGTATQDLYDDEGQEQSTDLVDMTNANPIEVTNDNISSILHQEVAYTKGKYYQLAEDIVLDNWSTAEKFAGILDGNGHTITLQGNSSCFIHFLTSDGVLQNIGFLGSVTTSVGDLANSGDACVVASCQGKVLNCYMKMSYGSTCKYASGLIGQTQAQGIVSNCAIHVTGGNTKFYPLAQEAVNSSKLFNCYWDSTSKDDSGKWADFPGMRVVTDRAEEYDCSQKDNAEMLNLLNTYKGANSVEWVADEDGFPILKKPEVKDKYTVSFTKADGTVVDNVQKNGISLKLQDVPASQNAGTLTVSGFDGKVAWLLSQYDSGKPSYEWAQEDQSNIWPGLYSGGLAVKGTGEATIVAWDESTLSHTVDKQDVPNENSVELARFKVTVTAGKVEAIRLVANGNEIKNNTVNVQGSEWVSLQPQTKEEGSDKWEDVPVSSVEFPNTNKDYSTEDYQAVVTNKEAKYRAKKPGTYALTIKGFDKEYTVNVTSQYVPIQSIKPAAEGTITVYPSNYQGDGSQHNLGIALSGGNFNSNVKVEPANASYAYNWTMDSSDKDVVEYTFDQGGTTGIVPKKTGEATLTVTSADPLQKTQVSGSTKVKFVYANEVAAKEFWAAMKALPEVDKITLDNETAVKDARFMYDNLSQDDKISTGDEMVEQLEASEAKIAAIKNPTVTLTAAEVSVVKNQSTDAVQIKEANNSGDQIKEAKSSDAKVAEASVKDGQLTITGVGAGTATVTVTTVSGATAEVKVTVAEPEATLNNTELNLLTGESAAVKVEKSNVEGDQIKEAQSSDAKVAEAAVKDGELTVKAVAAGTATITVTTTSGATAAVKVTVVKPEVTLNSTELKLKANETATVKADKVTVEGDQIAKAESSDAKVAEASVKDGQVTVKAVAAGTATITVTTAKGATATVKVTVEKAEEEKPVTPAKPAVTLTYKSLTVATKQSTAVVKIKTATVKGDKIKSAKSANSKIVAVSVKNGQLTVKGVATGTTSITVTTVKGATAKVNVRVLKPTASLNYKTFTVGVKCNTTAVKLSKTNFKNDKIRTAKSSNSKVAAVSVKNGQLTVKALKTGKTTITVTTNRGASAKVTVAVVKPVITLSHKAVSVTAKKTNSSVKIKKANIKGDKIKTAKSSNTKIATVSVKNGKLTIKGIKKGKTTVTVTTSNKGTAKVTVTVK